MKFDNSVRWLSLLLLFLLVVPHLPANAQVTAERTAGYRNANLLVSTDWVAQHASDANVRLVDMREEKAYVAGHMPQAVRIAEGPLRNQEEKFTYLPRPEQFAEMMAKAGIGNRTHVVIYDDQGGRMAARLWYVLHAFGHTRVSLINGGWLKWKSENRPVSLDTPSITMASFKIKTKPDLTCPLPEFLGRKPGVVVLDSRSPEEYVGNTVSPKATKAGRVPDAVNVEWKENVEGQNLEFKSADVLSRLYREKGVTPDKEIVVYCASGGRASQSLFALRLIGYSKVRIYYGSFSDYSALSDAPVEK